MKMFGECHAHIFLNGYDYRKAVETQKNGPRDALIRAHLEEYRKRGIRFVRDGGDHYGVSKRAARLAPEDRWKKLFRHEGISQTSSGSCR